MRRHGVTKGRIRIALAPGERHAGLTVNEYETLLMRHDLSEVLRDPLRFMAEKAGHILGNPRAIPAKTLDYAKYDLVRVFNRLLDAVGLRESMVETVLAQAIAMPAARFLRMKRSVSLLVSDRQSPGSRRDRRRHLPEPDPGAVAPRRPPRPRARRHPHALRLTPTPAQPPLCSRHTGAFSGNPGSSMASELLQEGQENRRKPNFSFSWSPGPPVIASVRTTPVATPSSQWLAA